MRSLLGDIKNDALLGSVLAVDDLQWLPKHWRGVGGDQWRNLGKAPKGLRTVNYFEPATIKRNNPLLRAVKLRCAYCTFEDRVHLNQYPGGPTADDIELAHARRKFEAQGWSFAKKPKCPQCIAEDEREIQAEEERAAMRKAKADLKVVDTQPQPEPQPPKQMGRDDRRIVFEKLNEAYGNETIGYNPGWSDTRVAKELGCPLEWVATVRIEMFGDIAANAETMAEFKTAQALVEEGRRIMLDFDARLTRMEVALREIEKALK